MHARTNPKEPKIPISRRPEPGLSDRLPQRVFQRPNAVDGLNRIDGPHRLANGIRNRQRVGLGADRQADSRGRRVLLEIRNIERRSQIGAKPVVHHIADHADHRHPRTIAGRAHTPHALSDGILSGPEATRERLTDHRRHLRADAVSGIDRASIDDAHSHRVEVARRHMTDIDLRQRHPTRPAVPRSRPASSWCCSARRSSASSPPPEPPGFPKFASARARGNWPSPGRRDSAREAPVAASSTPLASKPGSVRFNRCMLDSTTPANPSNTSDSATCAPTSTWRVFRSR